MYMNIKYYAFGVKNNHFLFNMHAHLHGIKTINFLGVGKKKNHNLTPLNS